jgi:hypothetical protein
VLPTAEATPACSRGSDDMIDSIAGGMMLAIPTPCTKNSMATIQIGVSTPTTASPSRDSAVSTRPVAETALAPYRFTMAVLSGANTSCATAKGSSRRPVSSGE